MQVYTAKLLVRLRAEWSTNTQHAMYKLSGCLLPPAVMHNAANATSNKQQGTVVVGGHRAAAWGACLAQGDSRHPIKDGECLLFRQGAVS
jgi:hypothetical protein